MKFINKIILCLIFVSFSSSIDIFSQLVVPVINQVDLIAKILVINRNMKQDGKPFVMGILFNGNSKSSTEIAEEIKMSFDKKGIKIKNHPINCIYFDINKYSKKGLEDAIFSSNINSLYIAPVRGINLSLISKICKEKNILSISSEPVNAEKYFTVSFDITNNQIKIIINYQSMLEENVDFSSYLLKVAKVINE